MEIHWAGNTQERFELVGKQNAVPAAGFQRWVEHVVNTSREWTEWQHKLFTVLRFDDVADRSFQLRLLEY